MTVFPLLELPREILLHILDHVSPEDRCRLRLVSKEVQSWVDHPSLWQNRNLKISTIPSQSQQSLHLWRVLEYRKITNLTLGFRICHPSMHEEALKNLITACPQLQEISVPFARLDVLLQALLIQSETSIRNLRVIGGGPFTESILEMLASQTQLNSLYIRVDRPLDFPLLCKTLCSLQQLETIVFSDVKLDRSQLEDYQVSESLQRMLYSLPNLRNLDFSTHRVQIQGALHGFNPPEEVSVCPADGPTLKSLNLHYLHIAWLESNVVSDFDFFQHVYGIRTLCIGAVMKRSLHALPLTAVMTAISKYLPNLTSLKLELIYESGVAYTNGRMEWLQKLPPTLTKLSIWQSIGILKEESLAILKNIPKQLHTGLRCLRLENSYLDLVGITYVERNFVNLQIFDFCVTEGVEDTDLQILQNMKSLKIWKVVKRAQATTNVF
jgi:hypothetical protein